MTWRTVAHDDRYEVSDTGEVRRISTRRVLRQSLNHNGYWVVTLMTDTKRRHKLYRVHRLVAAAFIGPCPHGKEVNHVDGHRRNNTVANLEYVTHRENLTHARLNVGERNGSAKLTAREVHEIRRLALPGLRNHHKLAIKFGVCRSLISQIVERKIWTHV